MSAVCTFGVRSDSPFGRAQVNPNSYYESMGRAGQRGGERERQLATFSRNAVVAAEVRSSLVQAAAKGSAQVFVPLAGAGDIRCILPVTGKLASFPMQSGGNRHGRVLSHLIP